MKEKLIYILSFVLVFALVSGMIIYFNTVYKNIFVFDFTPVAGHTEQTAAKPADSQIDSAKAAVQPNLVAADSLKQDSTKVKTDSLIVKTDSVKTEKPKVTEAAKSVVNDYSTLLPREKPIVVNTKEEIKTKKDSIYKSWVKETGKLYETMDSKKAAKVIQGYSDNIARDLLLSMKKKKAADILSEIRPDVVTRIISVN